MTPENNLRGEYPTKPPSLMISESFEERVSKNYGMRFLIHKKALETYTFLKYFIEFVSEPFIFIYFHYFRFLDFVFSSTYRFSIHSSIRSIIHSHMYKIRNGSEPTSQSAEMIEKSRKMQQQNSKCSPVHFSTDYK